MPVSGNCVLLLLPPELAPSLFPKDLYPAARDLAFLCVCAHLHPPPPHLCLTHPLSSECWWKPEVLGPLELGLQTSVSHSTWVMESNSSFLQEQ